MPFAKYDYYTCHVVLKIFGATYTGAPPGQTLAVCSHEHSPHGKAISCVGSDEAKREAEIEGEGEGERVREGKGGWLDVKSVEVSPPPLSIGLAIWDGNRLVG